MRHGAPWVPVAYACGYMLTNGWSFRDATGPLETFCPVTLEQLDAVKALVVRLKMEEVPAKELPRIIAIELIPMKEGISTPAYKSLCYYTLLRIGYPLPTGKSDDWLSIPPWALRLPKKRMRLSP